MTRGASVRRPSATQRLLNFLLTSSQNISRVGQSYDRYTPSPGLSSDTRRLRCRFDLPLPETLESRADDAIMAGPIALWDVPDTLRGRTWQADRVAILGLVQVDHRCVFGWMAFGVVQHRICHVGRTRAISWTQPELFQSAAREECEIHVAPL